MVSNESDMNSTLSHNISDFLYVNKEIESVSNDAPAVLNALGLGKLKYSPPKCYGRKKIYVHSKAAVTLEMGDVFENNDDFGKIDWMSNVH